MQVESDKEMTENNNTEDKDKDVNIDESANIENSNEERSSKIDESVNIENSNEEQSSKIVELANIENSNEERSSKIDQSEEVKKKSPVSVSVVGVRFRSCGKVYTFEIGNLEVTQGTKVVVDSKMGLSMGNVVTSKHVMERKGEPLKKVLRIANEQDFETAKNNRSFEDEARAFCVEKVKGLKMPMKIVTTETTLDKKRIVFYFTADGRIDFRELVRDLAGKFKTRIEMKQVGVRDEVKLLGGIGCCGRQACCSLFLTSFEPVTIRMAKQQDLSINQSKLSGICGRLMCCLGYEYKNGESYSPARVKRADKIANVASGLCDEAESKIEDGPGVAGESVITDKPSADKGIAENIKDKAEETKPKRPARRERHFKSHKRGAKKHDAEKSPEKTVTDKDKKSEDTSSTSRPMNKRKKFWRKKKQ
jgi:cell fate regulator YaaT (PSP1 superfamily)